MNTLRKSLIRAAVLAAMSVTGTAFAVPTSLDQFVIFSDSDLFIGGHSLVYGHIGSNNDLDGQGNSQFNGSVYVGGNYTPGSNVVIGSNGVTPGPNVQHPGPQPLTYPAFLAEVVVNGVADFGGSANAALASRIYGHVYADDVFLRTNVGIKKVGGLGGNLEYTGSFSRNSGASVEGLVNGVPWGPAITGSNPSAPAALGSTTTFGTIAMPTATIFSAGGVNQNNPGTLAPGTYGTLTTTQNQTVSLASGNYYFDAINTGSGLTLNIDLTSGNPVNLYIVGNATFAQNTVLMVKGAGTGGLYLPLSDVPSLARLINWETKGKFMLGGGNANAWTTIFGGFVYSSYFGSGDGLTIDQHVDWYGGLYSFDTMHLADHSRFTYVAPADNHEPPDDNGIPEPVTAGLCLLGMAALGLNAARRRRV